MRGGMYSLWLHDGPVSTLLVKAPGSPFWSDVVDLAERTYGVGAVSYTYDCEETTS